MYHILKVLIRLATIILRNNRGLKRPLSEITRTDDNAISERGVDK